MNEEDRTVKFIVIFLVFRLLLSIISDFQTMNMIGSRDVQEYYADLAYYLDPVVVPIYIISYIVLVGAIIFVVISKLIWNYKLGGFFVILEGVVDIVGSIIIVFVVGVNFSFGLIIDVIIIIMGVKLYKMG